MSNNQNQGASIEADLLSIGGQMANVMFNLAQLPGERITYQQAETFDSLRKKWDAARRTPVADGAALDLPPLPEAFGTMNSFDEEGYTTDWVLGFTAEQLQQYAREAISHYLRKQAGQVGAEAVGEIVANDPVHGWHMRALKPWHEIGEGALLYAGPPPRVTQSMVDAQNKILDQLERQRPRLDALKAKYGIGQEGEQPTINKGESNG